MEQLFDALMWRCYFYLMFYSQDATRVPNLHAIVLDCEIHKFMFSHYFFVDFGGSADLRAHP